MLLLAKNEITASLLSTKLHVPPTPHGLVPRSRLVEQLNVGLEGKLVLLSAPAGFGKTTLLSEVLDSIDCPIAWLSLDKGDNDPNLFWTYFIVALQGIEPDLGENSLTLLQSPDTHNIESILTVLINQIAGLPHQLTIVLDDYHEIKNESIHHGLAFLLEHLPPQACLVVSSRVDFALPLARMRGRGQLIELRADDLRFTLAETTSFLTEAMALRLSDDEVATLNNRTEGWIASLRMAAVSMQGREDIPDFIVAFSGTHRYILDYLSQEVINCQQPNVQSFLLETSILNRLSVPLCDAVTDRNDSREILDLLEADNLFLSPLDNERRWFRYHQLFAELLRSRLGVSQTDHVATLHRRASEWFEKEGFMGEAIEHAFSAKDLERAADLINEIVERMVKENKYSTLLSWLRKLPSELIAERLWLSFYGAYAYATIGQLDAVEPLIINAEKILYQASETSVPDHSGDFARIRGMVTAFHARSAWDRGDIPETMKLCTGGLKELPTDDMLARPHLKNVLGATYWAKGELTTAIQYLEEAELDGLKGNHFQIALSALGCRAGVYIAQAQLHRAVRICRDALQSMPNSGAYSSFPATCYAHVFLADVLYQWNELDQSMEHVITGIELGEQGGDVTIIQMGYTLLAKLHFAMGQTDAGMEAIRQAKAFKLRVGKNKLAFPTQVWLARIFILRGNLNEATELIDTWQEYPSTNHRKSAFLDASEVSPCSEDLLWSTGPNLTKARLSLAKGSIAGVPKLLNHLRQKAEEKQWVGELIEILILQALAFEAQHRTMEALEALERVIGIAAPEGYIRIFLDEGEPMLRLLHLAESKGIMPGYVSKLLSEFNSSILTSGDHLRKTESNHLSEVLSKGNSVQLIEPLTPREMDLLCLIADGLSNFEIANSLCVSVNTIKVHTRNLYGKLNVRSRTQALRRARELDLLPGGIR